MSAHEETVLLHEVPAVPVLVATLAAADHQGERHNGRSQAVHPPDDRHPPADHCCVTTCGSQVVHDVLWSIDTHRHQNHESTGDQRHREDGDVVAGEPVERVEAVLRLTIRLHQG